MYYYVVSQGKEWMERVTWRLYLLKQISHSQIKQRWISNQPANKDKSIQEWTLQKTISFIYKHKVNIRKRTTRR